jgi:ribonucleotide reductase beta subunit family protein with ferritin-like domain
MTEEMKFFIYLLEYYAAYKEKKTGDVFMEWEAHGITQKIYDNYWTYNTERMENAYMDIDSMILTGKPAW